MQVLGHPRGTDPDSPVTLTGVWGPEDAQFCPVATATPPTWTQDRPAVSALTGQVLGVAAIRTQAFIRQLHWDLT